MKKYRATSSEGLAHRNTYVRAGSKTSTVSTWLTITVVDQESGERVENAALVFTFPDGTTKEMKSGPDGVVELKDLSHKSVGVGGDFSNALLKESLHVVDLVEGAPREEQPPASPGGQGSQGGGKLALAAIETHKVKSGETLDSLARANNLTWQKLSEFNWGTSVPNEINQFLRTHVGCTRKTRDGNNYMFDSSDTPGLVYVPHPWSVVRVETGKSYTLHVTRKSMERVFDYSFARDGENVVLSFSVRDPQPSGLKIRLFEAPGSASPALRETWISEWCALHGNDPGFMKGGVVVEVKRGDSLSRIALKYGITAWPILYNHPANEAFRRLRPNPNLIEPGDRVYVPQISLSDGVNPIGPILDAKQDSASVSGGKRYKVTWDVEKNGYDPLSWINWLPECTVAPNQEAPALQGVGEDLCMPVFAVISGKTVLAVSLTPGQLTLDTKLKAASDFVPRESVLADGSTKLVVGKDKSATFTPSEEPITFI